jgi:hypothetical protein
LTIINRLCFALCGFDHLTGHRWPSASARTQRREQRQQLAQAMHGERRIACQLGTGNTIDIGPVPQDLQRRPIGEAHHHRGLANGQ